MSEEEKYYVLVEWNPKIFKHWSDLWIQLKRISKVRTCRPISESEVQSLLTRAQR